MLPDDCKTILLPIKKTYIESLMADIDSYCDGRTPQPGAWVKATTRLPGWGKKVRWREPGIYELPSKFAVSDMTNYNPNALLKWEWYDESTTTTESPAEQPGIDKAQVMRHAIAFANWLLPSGCVANEKDYELFMMKPEAVLAAEQPGREVEFGWVKNALEWAKDTIEFASDKMQCPEPWVETWGNHYMNAMHAIQEAQREIDPNSEAVLAAQEAFLEGQSNEWNNQQKEKPAEWSGEKEVKP